MTDIFEWEKYLKDNLEFPFLAEVCAYQENDDILILGALVSWEFTHAFYKESSKDQNAVFR
jgi:hypothetical protein